MITISSFTHRLGNQLFQIAAAYSLAKKHGVEFLCPEWKYQQYFKHRFNQYNDEPIEKYWSEDGFHFQEIPFHDNMAISGYFQSWKYFDINDVRNLFKINTDYYSFHVNLSCIFEGLFNIPDVKKDCCAIHVRRTDYLNYPDHHPLCSLDYYHKAMSESGFKNFIVFSDDTEWCKNNFKFSLFNLDWNIYYSEDHNDIEDFYIMSKCAGVIIANSTFSWWAAMLNKNAQIVISPHKDNWHGPAYAHWNHDDLIPGNWKQIKF